MSAYGRVLPSPNTSRGSADRQLADTAAYGPERSWWLRIRTLAGSAGGLHIRRYALGRPKENA